MEFPYFDMEFSYSEMVLSELFPCYFRPIYAISATLKFVLIKLFKVIVPDIPMNPCDPQDYPKANAHYFILSLILLWS